MASIIRGLWLLASAPDWQPGKWDQAVFLQPRQLRKAKGWTLDGRAIGSGHGTR